VTPNDRGYPISRWDATLASLANNPAASSTPNVPSLQAPARRPRGRPPGSHQRGRGAPSATASTSAAPHRGRPRGRPPGRGRPRGRGTLGGVQSTAIARTAAAAASRAVVGAFRAAANDGLNTTSLQPAAIARAAAAAAARAVSASYRVAENDVQSSRDAVGAQSQPIASTSQERNGNILTVPQQIDVSSDVTRMIISGRAAAAAAARAVAARAAANEQEEDAISVLESSSSGARHGIGLLSQGSREAQTSSGESMVPPSQHQPDGQDHMVISESDSDDDLQRVDFGNPRAAAASYRQPASIGPGSSRDPVEAQSEPIASTSYQHTNVFTSGNRLINSARAAAAAAARAAANEYEDSSSGARRSIRLLSHGSRTTWTSSGERVVVPIPPPQNQPDGHDHVVISDSDSDDDLQRVDFRNPPVPLNNAEPEVLHQNVEHQVQAVVPAVAPAAEVVAIRVFKVN
jgi:hypothetical protein